MNEVIRWMEAGWKLKVREGKGYLVSEEYSIDVVIYLRLTVESVLCNIRNVFFKLVFDKL